jgi:hypothetical protein
MTARNERFTMPPLSRRTAAITIATSSLLAAAAAVVTPITTATAAEPPPCTADNEHHCLAITNYDSRTLSFDIFDDGGKIGCFTVAGKTRRVEPNVHLPNGHTLTVGVYTSTGDECYASNRGVEFLGFYSHTVNQPTRYEWIDIK